MAAETGSGAAWSPGRAAGPGVERGEARFSPGGGAAAHVAPGGSSGGRAAGPGAAARHGVGRPVSPRRPGEGRGSEASGAARRESRAVLRRPEFAPTGPATLFGAGTAVGTGDMPPLALCGRAGSSRGWLWSEAGRGAPARGKAPRGAGTGAPAAAAPVELGTPWLPLS